MSKQPDRTPVPQLQLELQFERQSAGGSTLVIIVNFQALSGASLLLEIVHSKPTHVFDFRQSPDFFLSGLNRGKLFSVFNEIGTEYRLAPLNAFNDGEPWSELESAMRESTRSRRPILFFFENTSYRSSLRFWHQLFQREALGAVQVRTLGAPLLAPI